MNAPVSPSSSPSSSQASSFSGSPPPLPSLFDSVPLIPAVPPVARRLSEAAIAKLEALTKFPPTVNQDPITAARYMNDTALCAALKEFDENIFVYLNSKAISDKALNLILGYCPALQSLDLTGFSQITAVALPRIAQLSQLTALNLSQTQVRNLAPLKDLPRLMTVNFSDAPIVPDSLIPFLERHKNICNLSLPKKLPPGFFARFPSNSLTEISLNWDDSRIEEIYSFLKDSPHIKKVEFSNDTIPRELITWCPILGKDISVITPSGKFSFTSNFMA
ncbi:MAG: hypothetical protein LLG04_02310 [Parachlamydia sp.]|nr:hypothetical protein [Parachlamydia sp.]